MQIRIFVRRPAGLPPSSRSRPIAPPRSVARPTWSISSRRNISTICLNILEKSHLVPHLGDRALGERTGLVRACTKQFPYTHRIQLELCRALADRRQRLDHIVGQHTLSVESAPPRCPPPLRRLLHRN